MQGTILTNLISNKVHIFHAGDLDAKVYEVEVSVANVFYHQKLIVIFPICNSRITISVICCEK